MTTRNRTVDVDGINVFFREAGAAETPALWLLHGLPTSSHMHRELIPALADRHYAVAPGTWKTYVDHSSFEDRSRRRHDGPALNAGAAARGAALPLCPH